MTELNRIVAHQEQKILGSKLAMVKAIISAFNNPSLLPLWRNGKVTQKLENLAIYSENEALLSQLSALDSRQVECVPISSLWCDRYDLEGMKAEDRVALVTTNYRLTSSNIVVCFAIIDPNFFTPNPATGDIQQDRKIVEAAFFKKFGHQVYEERKELLVTKYDPFIHNGGKRLQWFRAVKFISAEDAAQVVNTTALTYLNDMTEELFQNLDTQSR
jgi:hypothetical protein